MEICRLGLDGATETKGRNLEISVESPFTLLNCRAAQVNTTLPAYSGTDCHCTTFHFTCGTAGALVHLWFRPTRRLARISEHILISMLAPRASPHHLRLLTPPIVLVGNRSLAQSIFYECLASTPPSLSMEPLHLPLLLPRRPVKVSTHHLRNMM
jgi:hypothetical protein